MIVPNTEGTDIEEGVKWVQQVNRGGAAKGRRQVLLGGQEVVPVGAGLVPARAAWRVEALEEKAAADGLF